MRTLIKVVVVGMMMLASQAYAGNGDLIVDGKLGVGTTVPGNIMEINKTFAAGSTQQDFLRITASQPGAWFSQNGIQFRWNDFGNSVAWNLGQVMGRAEGWPNYGGGLEFYTKNVSAGTTPAPTIKMVIDNAGNVGIGTQYPSYQLDVNGQVRAANVSVTSDERYKKNIIPVQNALSTLLKMEGVSYEWKKPEEYLSASAATVPVAGQATTASPGLPADGISAKKPEIKNFPAGRQFGVIAQAIEKVLPEVVNTDASGDKAVAYFGIIPVLIEAIKEQQVQIEQLKKLIATH